MMMDGMDDPTHQSRTVWVGELDNWVTDDFLRQMFLPHSAYVVNVKVIREKGSGAAAGYGFVEFVTHEIAEQVLQSYVGQPIPGAPNKRYRLNWAQFGIGEKKPMAPLQAHHSIFVGDLAPEVTDQLLEQTFRQNFQSVANAKVVTDAATGKPKGYGFVRFFDENEAKRAITELNGQFLMSRAMRISTATPKQKPEMGGGMQHQPLDPYAMAYGGAYGASYGAAVPPPMAMPMSMSAGHESTEDDPSNTTVFIGNLHTAVTNDMLHHAFERYGQIHSVKIPPGKGCGFVQFMTHESASMAIVGMNGKHLGPTAVRTSWGKSGAKKPGDGPSSAPYAMNVSAPSPMAVPPSPYGFSYPSYDPSAAQYFAPFGMYPPASSSMGGGASAAGGQASSNGHGHSHSLSMNGIAPLQMPSSALGPILQDDTAPYLDGSKPADVPILNARYRHQHSAQFALGFADSHSWSTVVKRTTS